jgi:hypothetical protein
LQKYATAAPLALSRKRARDLQKEVVLRSNQRPRDLQKEAVAVSCN